MIQIKILKNQTDRPMGFRISGHSGYEEAGKDIVCSAVSMLATNTVNAIESFTADEQDVLAVNEEEGFFEFRLKTVSQESELLLKTFALGAETLAKSYKKFVQVK